MRRWFNLALVIALVVVGVSAVAAIATSQRPGPSPAPTGSGAPGPSAGPSASAAPGITSAAFRGPAWPLTLVHRPLDNPGSAKSWFAFDHWWAVLPAANGESRIFRLDDKTQAWVDTGTLVDPRAAAHADVVWDGTHLLVASAPDRVTAGSGITFSRFGYQTAIQRFVIDPDYPISLSPTGGQVWIDRDPGGRLWVALVTQGSLRVAHSTTDDAHWTGLAPFSPAGARAIGALTFASASDAMSLVYSFVGEAAFHVASPTAAGDWSDDRVDLVGAQASPTELEATVAGSAGKRMLVVVARTPSTGLGNNLLPAVFAAVRNGPSDWRQGVVNRVKDNVGRFAVVLDQTAGLLTVVAAHPNGGGQLVAKSAPLATLSFDTGSGTELVTSASDPELDVPASPRRLAPISTPALVLAADQTTGHIVHALIADRTATLPPSRLDTPPPKPAALPAAPIVVARDAFDRWAPGATVTSWSISDRSTVKGNLVAATAANDRIMELVRTSTAGQLRACRTAPKTATGTSRTEIVVRLRGVGSSDATIASVRGPGGEVASIRVTTHGLLAYYSGATKVRTTIPFTSGRWYRIVIDVSLATKRFSVTVSPVGGARVLAASAVPWRTGAVTGIDTVCVETPNGGPADALDVSSLALSRA